MWVRSLGLEDFLEEDNGTPLQYSCLEYPMDSELPSIGYQRVGRNWSNSAHKAQAIIKYSYISNVEVCYHRDK